VFFQAIIYKHSPSFVEADWVFYFGIFPVKIFAQILTNQAVKTLIRLFDHISIKVAFASTYLPDDLIFSTADRLRRVLIFSITAYAVAGLMKPKDTVSELPKIGCDSITSHLSRNVRIIRFCRKHLVKPINCS